MSSFEKESSPLTPYEQAQQSESQDLLHAGASLLLRCHSLIRLMGFDSDALEELCKILFINIQNPARVILFLNQNIDNQEIIQSVFNEFKKEDCYYLYENSEKIEIIPQLFRGVLLNLNTFNWSNLTYQTKGLLFEIFINKIQKQETYSVSNTQIAHSIADYMITVLDPKKGELIADPCFGAGTFLRKVYQYIYQNPILDFKDEIEKKVICGADQPTSFTLAKRLLWMHGMKLADIQLNVYPITHKNKFTDVKYMVYGTFDIVFADLVGLSSAEYSLSEMTKIDLLLLQHCVDLLKDGGRMSILIKDESLLGHNFTTIRKIESQGKLIKITSLPIPSQASPKIMIVFFQKYTLDEKKQYDLNRVFDYKITYAAIEKVGKGVALFDTYDRTQNQLLLLAKEYKDYLIDGEIKNQILLEVTNYSKIANWNMAYLKNMIFEKVKTYPYKKLSELLIPNRNYITIQDTTSYKRVKVRLYNQGVELRDEVIGTHIMTKRQVKIEKGQLIVAKLNTMNGAVGLVPDTLHDAIVTSDFLTYTVKTDLILPQYLEFLIASQPFATYLSGITTGSVMERLNPSLFLNIEIPIPILEEQMALCEKMIKLRHQMKEIKQIFYDEKAIFENKIFKIK
jgi:N-6 DNA Methylase